jgi:hypothetical protein
MPRYRPNILVAGMIAADPHQGGATWAVLQYVLGLRELGCEVTFVDPIRAASVKPSGCNLQTSSNADYFRQVASDFGLENASSLLVDETHDSIGLSYEALLAKARRCDLLLNISGLLVDEALLSAISVRAYLDLDPAFNQLWHAQGVDVRFARHTQFVTIGQCIGDADCPVPSCGLSWIKTLQPIVLSHWPYVDSPYEAPFTTVGHWRSYGSITADGVFYGQKAHSFRKIIGLPKMTQARFELALGIHPAEIGDLALMADNNWHLIDPAQVAGTPTNYQRFVQGSLGELAVAKSGYVTSRCGWFSDRSLCYLASGRPVVAQETGFSRTIAARPGIAYFTTAEEAATACDDIISRYEAHRRGAREIAIEYFDSAKVLSRLLGKLGIEL